MVHFGPFWPEESHFGPFRSTNRTLAIPEIEPRLEGDHNNAAMITEGPESKLAGSPLSSKDPALRTPSPFWRETVPD